MARRRQHDLAPAPTPVRLPADVLAEIDRLVERSKELTRSQVVRILLRRALRARGATSADAGLRVG